MINRSLVVVFLLSPLGCGDTNSKATSSPPDLSAEDTDTPPTEPNDVSSFLEPIAEEYDLPALGGARIQAGLVTDWGVVGVRKLGDDTEATIDDKWHLGSCTKAMTGTLVAAHIDDGLVEWTSTVEALFPDIDVHEDFRSVTLQMLLSHRAGIDDTARHEAVGWASSSDVEQYRQNIAETILSRAPDQGQDVYQYSNYGIVIAGAALERLTGESWESLMEDRIFEPLGMDSCGFGVSDKAGDVSQPWGHRGDSPQNIDNAPVLGPAATVHCSLQDWAWFIADQMRAYRGEESLLSAAQGEQMFTAQLNGYAMGWGVYTDDDLGFVFSHAGNNTVNFAEVVALPDRDEAYLAVTNIGDMELYDALRDTYSMLLALD